MDNDIAAPIPAAVQARREVGIPCPRTRRWTMALVFAMSSLAAHAGTMGPLITDRPVHWHGATIKLGDAEAQVRKAVGRYPDSAQPLYIDDRYPVGERWSFLGDRQDRRELYVEFTRGRVSRVWTETADDSGKPLSQLP
jgi:hypothetical protein